jgi:hypothetical protein
MREKKLSPLVISLRHNYESISRASFNKDPITLQEYNASKGVAYYIKKCIAKYLVSYINPLLHEHFVKNGFFIEKSHITSSTCYKTIKTASILINLAQVLTEPLSAFATT